jgi:hypothetical protein
MIKFDEKYQINNGQESIIFSQGKEGSITGKYNSGTLTGKLEGNVLTGTYHNQKNNSAGLIEITFHENGFKAKWKQGLEPGPMRGKWSARMTADNSAAETKIKVGVYAGMEGDYGEHNECLSQGDQPDFIAVGFFTTVSENKEDEYYGFVGLVISNRSSKERTEVISFPQNGMSCFAVDWGGEAMNEDDVDLYAALRDNFPNELKTIDAMMDKYFQTDDEEYFEVKIDIDDNDRLSSIYPGQDLDLEDTPKSNGFNLGQIVSL